ncbi:MAG: DUF2782 domain-containing protein [Pseudomonadota bacterium]
MMHKLTTALLFAFALPALAGEMPPPPAPAAEAAPPPATGLEEEIQPEVRIIKRDDAVVREYRVNGALYMIKVEPRVGAPYYLIDTTGDGNLNARRSELDPAFVVPSWMIFRW